jgi:hypothetical protein
MLAGLVALVVGVAVWRYVASEPTSGRLVVREVEGALTIRRGVETVHAAAGDVVGAEDHLTTGAAGQALLELTPGTRIRIGASTELTVLQVGAEGVRLALEDGQLQATVRPSAGAVRVASRGREVVSTQGAFRVGVAGDVLAVAAEEGEVVLTGVEPPGLLGVGTQTVAVGDQRTTAPIPEALLLAVEWPEPGRTRAPTERVRGTTAPGASVVAEGSFGRRAVRAGSDGVFTLELPLEEGTNAVTVRAEDLLGGASSVAGELPTRDTTGPSLRGE